jgi:hypothetical protein
VSRWTRRGVSGHDEAAHFSLIVVSATSRLKSSAFTNEQSKQKYMNADQVSQGAQCSLTLSHNQEIIMDKLDAIVFLGWSSFLVVMNVTGYELIACQAAWLSLCFIGRAIIDRKLAS